MIKTAVTAKIEAALDKTKSGRSSLKIWRQAEVVCFERRATIPADFECRIGLVNGLFKIRFDLEIAQDAGVLSPVEFEYFKMFFEDLADEIRTLEDEFGEFAFLTEVQPKNDSQILSEMQSAVSRLKERIELINQMISKRKQWINAGLWASLIQIRLEKVLAQVKESPGPGMGKEFNNLKIEIARLQSRANILLNTLNTPA